VDEVSLDHIRAKIEEEVEKRFPAGTIERVVLLQYGDEPVVEPGELFVRVIVKADEGRKSQEQALQAFDEANDAAIKEFRNDLSTRLPQARRLEFRASSDTGHGPRIMLGAAAVSIEARAMEGAELTPVMARLGAQDLETLDTLITAGIASNRADAVRWALARVREKPAYQRLCERATELEELKSQF
jgi:hypothetical protein